MVSVKTIIALYTIIGFTLLLLGLAIIYFANEGLIPFNNVLTRFIMIIIGALCIFVGIHWFTVGVASLRSR